MELGVELKRGITKLEELISETEEYYALIHQQLPLIEKNIELTEQETNIIITYFIETEIKDEQQKGMTDEQRLIGQTLESVKANVAGISGYLLNHDAINRRLEAFLTNKAGQSSFQFFFSMVEKIEEILEDIHDISLNSIIFASNLGEKGRGFGVVSDFIHGTASALDVQFNTIEENSLLLKEWHEQLQEGIEKVVAQQERALASYVRPLEQVFGDLDDSVRTLSSVLRNQLSNVKGVISPFQELMVLIQRQDIVRQSMENAIKCMRILIEEAEKVPKPKDSQEVHMERAHFLKKGSELVYSLGDVMYSQLEDNLDDIVGITASMVEALDGLQEDSEEVCSFFAGNDQEGKTQTASVDHSFVGLVSFIGEFSELLESIFAALKELARDHQSFDETIAVMDTGMKSIEQKVKVLAKVKVLSRIELVQMGSEGNVFAADIESVIGAIQTTVGENSDAFGTLQTTLKRDLEEFKRIVEENQGVVDDATMKLEGSIQELKMASEIIIQAVRALTREIANLYGQMEVVHGELKRAETVKDLGRTLLQQIEGIKVLAKKEEDRLFSQYGISEYTLESEKLKSFYAMFTGYLERQTAKQVLQHEEYDQGTDEGELTLF